MANIHSLTVVDTITGISASAPVDLLCADGITAKKITTQLYDISSLPFVETDTQNADTRYFTVIWDCISGFELVEETYNQVYALIEHECPACDYESPEDLILQAIQGGNRENDLISWQATALDTMVIPQKLFTSISLFASKGEFQIEQTLNDFSVYFSPSAGTLFMSTVISEDKIGTTPPQTNVPAGIDLNPISIENTYLVTCVRSGVLQLNLMR